MDGRWEEVMLRSGLCEAVVSEGVQSLSFERKTR
jgi:hypothetical protein